MKKFLLAFIEQMRVPDFLNTLNCEQTGFNCSLCQNNRIPVTGDSLLPCVDIPVILVSKRTDNTDRIAIRFKKRDKCPVFYQTYDR
jgi:hypothetical protein